MVKIISNADEVQRKIIAVAKQLSKETLKATLFAALEEVANVSTAKYFRRTSIKGALSYAPIAGKITNRTLRLIGSISGGFRFSAHPIPHSVSAKMSRKPSISGGSDLEKGKKESIREVRVSGSQIQGIIGSRVPYAEIQESGGDIKTKITRKMRKFFWARYYETGDDKWKGMALTSNMFIRGKISARAYLQPAVKESKQIITDLFRLAITETWERKNI